jgi:hypothetical protein
MKLDFDIDADWQEWSTRSFTRAERLEMKPVMELMMREQLPIFHSYVHFHPFWTKASLIHAFGKLSAGIAMHARVPKWRYISQFGWCLADLCFEKRDVPTKDMVGVVFAAELVRRIGFPIDCAAGIVGSISEIGSPRRGERWTQSRLALGAQYLHTPESIWGIFDRIYPETPVPNFVESEEEFQDAMVAFILALYRRQNK